MRAREADKLAERFAKLSRADQEILQAIESEYERGGESGGMAALCRFSETSPAAYLRILSTLHPEIARAAIEDALIDFGLTNADVRRMLAAKLDKH